MADRTGWVNLGVPFSTRLLPEEIWIDKVASIHMGYLIAVSGRC